MRDTSLAVRAAAALVLAACGYSTSARAISGGLPGAGAGALAGGPLRVPGTCGGSSRRLVERGHVHVYLAGASVLPSRGRDRQGRRGKVPSAAPVAQREGAPNHAEGSSRFCCPRRGRRGGAIAADPPGFMQRVTPGRVLQPAWSAYQAVYQDGALPSKTKQLIALSVSAQIPCDYCVHAHTLRARAAGASDDEIKEAIAVAGTVRFWSTMLNGAAYDMQAFRQELSGTAVSGAPR